MMRADSLLEQEHQCNVATAQEAQLFEQRALDVMRDAGFRITSPRVQVVRVLGESNRAQSAYHIHEKIISRGGKIDVVSVYRILSALQSVGLIHHIGIVDGYFPCRAKDEHSHEMQHLVCETCGCVTEVSTPDEALKSISANIANFHFKISELRVEVMGLCQHCSKAS